MCMLIGKETKPLERLCYTINVVRIVNFYICTENMSLMWYLNSMVIEQFCIGYMYVKLTAMTISKNQLTLYRCPGGNTIQT